MSHPDWDVPLQLLDLRVRIYKYWRTHHPSGKFPPVLAVVLYHGIETWNVPQSFAELIDNDCFDGEHEDTFNCTYHLVNVRTIDDDELSSDPNLRAGLLIQKYIWEPERLMEVVPRVLRTWRRKRSLLRGCMTYILRKLAYSSYRRKLQEVVLETIPEERNMFVSIADGLRMEGKAGMLLRQLRTRFHRVPAAVKRTIKEANEAQLDRWAVRFVNASTIDEVFGDALRA